jgi:hypothetical protein
MKKNDSDGFGADGKLRSALSRRDFSKLGFGALGAILPGPRLLAANAAGTPAEESANDIYISPDGSHRGAGTQARAPADFRPAASLCGCAGASTA